jgi:S1-C subfamily serine protease
MRATITMFLAIAGIPAVIFAAPSAPLAAPLCFWRGADMQPAAESSPAAPVLAKERGMLVERVAAGSPAAQAGLKPGDIVTALDGIPVSTERSLALAVADHCCGPTVALRVWRDQHGQLIKLAPSPASPT